MRGGPFVCGTYADQHEAAAAGGTRGLTRDARTVYWRLLGCKWAEVGASAQKLRVPDVNTLLALGSDPL